MKKTLVMFACLFSLMPFAQAGDRPPRFEITPFGGYRMSGSIPLDDPTLNKLELGDGKVYGLSAGMLVPEGLVEFMWTHQDSTARVIPDNSVEAQSFDLNTDQFHLNGLYYPPGFEEGPQPYAMAGLGATRYVADDIDGETTRFSWALGGGVRLPFAKRLAVRLEAKWNPALSSSSGSVFCSSATGRCIAAVGGELINQFDFLAGLSVRL